MPRIATLLAFLLCFTVAIGCAEPDEAPEAPDAAEETEAMEDDAPMNEPTMAVGDCTAQGTGALIAATNFRKVDCGSDEAESRITQIVDDRNGCPEGQAAVTPVGAGNPTYCLEAIE